MARALLCPNGMNKLSKTRTFLTIGLGVIGALTALAAPVLAQDRTTSPANLDQVNLSTINGHPIKVGEHNEYYNQHPKFSIGLNPLGLVMGMYGLSGTYAVSDHVGVRGEFLIAHNALGESGANGSSLQFGAPIFFKQMYQGFFLEPGLTVRSSSRKDWDGNAQDVSTVGPHIMAGWQWRWDSGFTASLAFGATRDVSSNNDNNDVGYDNNEVTPTSYFHTGYTF
jgi:hypothetical protein